MVETPLTVPDLIGCPPLVVGLVEGSGVVLGLADGMTEGEGEAEIDGVAEGEGVSLPMKLVVALNARKPRVPRMIIVRRPARNDFICPILYTKESRQYKFLRF